MTTIDERNTRANYDAANAAHAEGRHGPGASIQDRRFWIHLGCRGCALAGVPTWEGDHSDRGEFYGFQMFSAHANDAVAHALHTAIWGTEKLALSREDGLGLVRDYVRAVSRVHPEVHDTEPECAIVEAVNLYFGYVGYVGIDRGDLYR